MTYNPLTNKYKKVASINKFLIYCAKTGAKFKVMIGSTETGLRYDLGLFKESGNVCWDDLEVLICFVKDCAKCKRGKYWVDMWSNDLPFELKKSNYKNKTANELVEEFEKSMINVKKIKKVLTK